MFKAWDAVVKGCLQGDKGDVATISCVPAVFLNILTALLAFAGLVAFGMFIVGAFKFMNSAGDQKKLDGAKNNFKYGFIGLAIVFGSFLAINIISQVTRTPCIIKFGFGCEQTVLLPPK